MLLTPALEQMGAPQLARVAARFAPRETGSGVARIRAAVAAVLESPLRLGAVVEGLPPLSRFLLSEVRRGGGVADGWALMTAARARGLTPEGGARPKVELLRHYRPAEFEGIELLWGATEEGLLLPVTLPNPFVAGFGRSLQLGSPLLTADARLLRLLPPDAPPGWPAPLPGPRPVAAPLAALPRREAPPPGSGPALLQLQLLELLRGVAEAGSLPLTRAGEYNRAALRRLERSLPALSDPQWGGLPLWLDLALGLRLLRLDEGETRVRPSTPPATFARTTPDQLIAALAGVFPQLELPLNAGEIASGLGTGRSEALRACLLGLLGALPHPTGLEELTEALRLSAPPAALSDPWGRRGEGWIAAVRGLLIGPLRLLGLVSLGEGGNPAVASLLGPSAPPVLAAPVSGPAWVVQPNFELLAYPAQLTPERTALLAAAQATHFYPQTVSYRLTRESVHAALEGGLSLDALLDGLGAASAAPLPPGVRSTLEGWAERRERLTLRRGATLLEYATGEARDAALCPGDRPLGAALRLLAPGAAPPAGAPLLRYDSAPPRSLIPQPDGSLRVGGPLDLGTRALLERAMQRQGDGYSLGGGPLPAELLPALEARMRGSLPPALRVQLQIRGGQEAPPALAAATLLQHRQAWALAELPGLAPHVEAQLSPELLLIRAGSEAAVRSALEGLGLPPSRILSDGAAPVAAGPTGEGAPAYVFPHDTRGKSRLLEEAASARAPLQLMFQTESYSGWSGESRPGRIRQVRVRLLRLDRSGNTPYLDALELDQDGESGDRLRIRVSYILGIAPVSWA